MKRAHISDRSSGTERSGLNRFIRVLDIVMLSVIGAVALCAALLGVATLWLTPSRLSAIAEEQAEKYLDADIEVGDIRFTLWSTFPRFSVEMDSIRIDSKRFGSLTPQQRDSLPVDAAFLASAAHFKGGIDILALASGRISLSDVAVDSLRVNIVALNDSLANYDIVRSKDDTPVSVPRVSADLVVLTHPQPITYYSAVEGTEARMDLGKVALRRLGKRSDDYDMTLTGKVSLMADGLRVLSGFPFSLKGNVGLAFKPFGVDFRDYNIDLGNLKGRMNLSMNVGDRVDVKRFDYSLSAVDLMKLAHYIPARYIPEMKNVKADMAVDMTARLLKPYHYSPSSLPSIAVDCSVPQGSATYTLDSGSRYSVDDLSLDASFVFDGDDPDASYFDIRRMEVAAPGLDLALSGRVTDLTGNPLVTSTVDCNADISALSREIAELSPYGLRGKVHLLSDVGFRILTPDSPQLGAVSVTGRLDAEDYRVALPDKDLDFSGRTLDMAFASRVPADAMPEADLSEIDFTAKGVTFRFKGRGVDLSATGVDASGNFDGMDLRDGTPVDAVVSADKVTLVAGQGDVRVALSDMKAKGNVVTAKGKYGTSVVMKGDAAALALSGARFDLKGIGAGFDMIPGRVAYRPIPYKEHDDAASLRNLRHTMEAVSVSAPASLRRFIDNNDVRLRLQVASGRFSAKAFPADNRLKNVDLAITNDSILLRSLDFRSNLNDVRLSASLGNLHAIISEDTPQIIPLRMNLDLGTVNINDLAYNYEMGVKAVTGHDAYHAQKHSELQPSPRDSVAVLIPRNIKADIRAAARETVYTNLHLYDLSTGLSLDDGVAELKNLHIDSDFGHALLSLGYDTRDINAMGLKIDAGLNDIDVVRFFQNFHTLLLMMPEAKNLSGDVSLHLDGDMEIFPTMCINGPDIDAGLTFRGRHLMLHQTPFIRRITRMMLIHTDGSIKIENINMHASLHDNLLELSPFMVQFDRYKMEMEGVNNLSGDMYYHIGVLKSPIPFGFGINIEGAFAHPELHFGGAGFDNDHALRIAESMEGAFSFNVTKEAKYFIKEMIHRAALAARPAPAATASR